MDVVEETRRTLFACSALQEKHKREESFRSASRFAAEGTAPKSAGGSVFSFLKPKPHSQAAFVSAEEEA